MRIPSVVILIRHGESQHHVLGLTGGWTDTALTPLGERQAKLVAARLKDELSGAAVRLYTSDLKRAAQTAAAIAGALNVAARPDHRLREHNNGEAANLTHKEALARWPDWYGRPLPLDVAIYPGSESGRAFYDRCASFIDGLEGNEATPVVVSHGGTLICLVGRWLGFSVEALEPIGFEFHTTSITVLRHVRDERSPRTFGRVIERLNDTSHLSSAEGRNGLGKILA